MSDEQRITKVEKEKDPRRVENGKRLALVSKAAKERKAMQHAEAEHCEQTVYEESKSSDDYLTPTVLTGVGVLTGLVSLYFAYRQDRRSQTQTQNTTKSKQQQPEATLLDSDSRPCKLRSLDD